MAEPTTTNPGNLGSGVAMLVTGAEEYGVASVQRHLVEAFPEMETIALGAGAQTDWLAQRVQAQWLAQRVHGGSAESRSRFTRLDGLSTWSADGGPLTVARSMPAMVRHAERTAAELVPVLTEKQIQLVHVHWLPQVVVGRFLREAGFKVIWHLHNSSAPGATAGVRRRVNHRVAGRGADHLLAVSNYVADTWQGAGPDVTVIHNGAEPRTPHAPTAKATDFLAADVEPPPGPVRCLAAGRLEHDKGHHVAVGAVAAAVAKGLDVTLDIAGGPTESDYARSLLGQAADAGLISDPVLPAESDRVRLLGHVDDLRSRHADYDLGFQSRISPEPCSVWVAEALVDGLPLIASNGGGTPELVMDGVTGILVAPDSVEEAATALIDLVKRRGRLQAMAAAAQASAPDRSLARQLEQTATLYDQLLAP